MAIAVANRYARALADVVARTGNYRAVLGELDQFATAYRESAELRAVFETPAVNLTQKIKVVEAIAARLRVSPLTTNFLRVLVTNYRMAMLEEIRGGFAKIANERMGIVQVKVFSAAGLLQPEKQALRARFLEITRQQVELEFHEDPELVGGVLAQIRSTVYDGSIRGHLERIRQRLVAG